MLQLWKKSRWGAFVLVLALALCSACVPALADAPRTFVVDAAHTGAEEGTNALPDITIGAALARVEPGRGDTVLVRSGTYPERVTVPAATALVSEDGAHDTFVVDAGADGEDVIVLVDGAVLRGVTLWRHAGAAVVAPAGAEITNCIFHANGVGVRVDGGGAARIVNNTFHRNDAGVRVAAGASVRNLRNNAFTRNGTAVEVAGAPGDAGAEVTTNYNAFHENSTVYAGMDPGMEDFVSNPLFVGVDTFNFHLRLDSQLRDRGDPAPAYFDKDGSRNDVGVDGGPHGNQDLLEPAVLVTTAPSPPEIPELSTVLFDASASNDAWGISQYAWDFDALDGVIVEGTGDSVGVLYDAPGGYLVTLRATDNSGRVGEAVVNVRVGDPPRITLLEAAPAIGVAPLTVDFSAAATASAAGPMAYAWDFDGDGAADAESAEAVYTWEAGARPGLKQVLLTVTDADGVVTQRRHTVTLARYTPVLSERLSAADVRFVPVTDTGTAVDGAGLTVPANALNETMTIGVAPVPEDDIAVAPPGEATLARISVSPAGLRLARWVRVQVPVPQPVSDATDIAVWAFDPDAQAWLDTDIHRVRLLGTGEAPVVAFDIARFGVFAVTRLGAEPEPEETGPCFIATAAYGTPLAGEIDTLRAWRDRRLLDSAAGTAFVDVYYRLSPPLAEWVARHPALAALARIVLAPVVWLVRLGWPGLAILALAGVVLARTRWYPGVPGARRV